MEKIVVEICAGTACYVLGAPDMFALKEKLSERELEQIELKVSTCLDFCKDEKSHPPYVVINGKVYENMNLEKLISEVRKLLN